jgi:hypothetical protein
MANAFSKEEIVFFEQVLEGFDPNNITAKKVNKYQPPSTQFERSALTVWRPVPYISRVDEGLTVSTYKDITQLSVPTTLNSNASSPSDIHNVPFTMNAVELNDTQQRDKKVRSALQALSAKIDRLVANRIATYGSLWVGKTGSASIADYKDAADCEVQMSIRDVPIDDPRTLIMNPTDYNGLSGTLAGGTNKVQTGVGLTAWERSKIPQIASFDSFKANFMPAMAAESSTGSFALNGIMTYVPDNIDANGNNVDNRYHTITVKTGTGAPAIGDRFTIAGVNSVGLINKEDSGQLQTFVIVGGTAVGTAPTTTAWTISPPIIDVAGSTQAEKDYGNCSAPGADSAAITFLNTVAAPSNVFFQDNAVEIIHGSLATADLSGGAGMAVMRESTDSGIEIVFAKQSAIDTLSTKYRLTMWANANVLIPDMCGILVGDQT